MFVIEKMQINKLQVRPIVSNRALFISMGARPCKDESPATSDCVNDPTPYGAKKTQLLALGQKIAEAAAEKLDSEGKSPDLNVSPKNL